MPLGLFPPLNYQERGLLGVACHPIFAANPKIYTTEPADSGVADFTTTEPATGFDHQNMMAEWTVSSTNPNVIAPASRREILRIDHPAFNHDGGEGEDQGDGHRKVDGNAQRLESVYGKNLRIDVDAATRPTASTAFRPTTRSSASRGWTKSGPTACAIPTSSASIRPPATSMSAMPARTGSRKSIS